LQKLNSSDCKIGIFKALLMENITILAEKLYDAQPLFKGRLIEIGDILKEDRINLLQYCFKRYDISFNCSLVTSYSLLWEDFCREDWIVLIKKMFPRENFNKHSVKDISSGWYSDILLLNGIIGIDPFNLIFNDFDITEEEKRDFFEYLKYRGEYSFYINLRELIEDVVYFDDFEFLQKIVNKKEKLIQEGFIPSEPYQEVIMKFSSFEKKI
jgi:hypothetical protein